MAEIQLTQAQQAAVDNRGGSLLVSAAAGSGKTKVLVERLFAYMERERCDVDDFLIITYTKAAAAELRGKIAAELSRRVAVHPESGHPAPASSFVSIRRTSRRWTRSAPPCCGRTCICSPATGSTR